jgi:hypothetical protein
MDKTKLAERLANRQLPPAAANGAVPTHLNGAKLAEAATYLKSARTCVLTWVRQNYVLSENVDQYTDDVRDLLAWAEMLGDMRRKLEVKASILGV